MNEFTIITVIGRPLGEVFAVARDVAKMPMWNPGMSEARIEGGGPLEPGATLVFRGTFLGRAYDSHAVCTACIENKQIATKSTSGPFYLETDTTFEPVDAGTRVTANYRGESRGFFKLAEPLVVRLAKKNFETAGENLRTLLEDHAL
jgi:ribosome-associated toxin RatA of RatAB toxin-antitoxin module